MNGKMTSIFTVWDIDDNGKSAVVRMSTSRKIREDEKSLLGCEKLNKNGYISTSWSFVNFVGKAYNQLKKYEVSEKTRITNLDMRVEQEPYFNEETQQVVYKNSPRYTVFEFELANFDNNARTGFDAAPKVAEEPKVATKQAPVPSVPEMSEDEYPF